MYTKASIATLLLCGIIFCSANPVPAKKTVILPGDDKTNWEAFYNATKNNPPVSRSADENIFDKILTINAKERGNAGRSGDNVFLFEGDIEMTRAEAIKIIQDDAGTSRQRRAVIKNEGRLWGKNPSYAIDSSLSLHTANIKRAIGELEATLPCMGKWRDITGSTKGGDYMTFFRGNGCYSYIGRVGGHQRISIGDGCQYHGIIVHEIGHAMGLWHEQSRPDRDDYVTIQRENIIPAMEFNFNKYTTDQIDSRGISYDYDSVMHYGEYAFSRNRKRTIVSKPIGKRFGQRNGLSAKDKKQLQILYGCSETKPTTKPVKPTTKPNPSGCSDVQTANNCNFWKGKGYCQQTYVNYMKKNCCRTCGFITASCTDKHENCPNWEKSGFCSGGRYDTYMKNNCAKSCGFTC